MRQRAACCPYRHFSSLQVAGAAQLSLQLHAQTNPSTSHALPEAACPCLPLGVPGRRVAPLTGTGTRMAPTGRAPVPAAMPSHQSPYSLLVRSREGIGVHCISGSVWRQYRLKRQGLVSRPRWLCRQSGCGSLFLPAGAEQPDWEPPYVCVSLSAAASVVYYSWHSAPYVLTPLA